MHTHTYIYIQKSIDKIVQMHLLCINSKLFRRYIFEGFNYVVFFFETYFKSRHFDTSIRSFLEITFLEFFLCWFNFYSFIFCKLK